MLKVFTFSTLFVLLLLLLLAGSRIASQEQWGYVSEENVSNIVNDWRISQGKKPYTNSQSLCILADIRLKEVQKDFSHDQFRKWSDRFLEETSFVSLGENLAREYSSNPAEYLEAWLNSPTHRENLEYNFTHSCIQCENSYCVQIFGSQTPFPVKEP